MDNYVYNAINGYFDVLSKAGYYSKKDTNSLLVVLFYYNLAYNDYRGYISESDYRLIEKALNCLYGTNCLIPYPDYLKMGTLRLGDITEVLYRTKALEAKTDEIDDKVEEIEDNLTIVENRLDVIENTPVVKSKDNIQDIPDIEFDNDSPTYTKNA